MLLTLNYGNLLKPLINLKNMSQWMTLYFGAKLSEKYMQKNISLVLFVYIYFICYLLLFIVMEDHKK